MEPILLRLDTLINNYTSIDLMQGYNYILEAHITDNYKDVDLTGITVQLQMQKPDKKFIIQTENIIIEGNKIKATLDKDFTRIDGQANLQVVLFKDNFTFGSWVVKAKIKPSAINDNDGQSENKVTITEALVNKISEAEITKVELDKSIANGDVTAIKGNVDKIKDVEIPKINEQLESIVNEIPNGKLNLLLNKTENYDELANKSVSIFGDSISYGATVTDFLNNPYVQILKRSLYGKYKDNNYGFVSFTERTQNNPNAFAKINSANFEFISDGNEHYHVGDTLMRANVTSSNIAYNFKKYFSKFRVGYKQQPNGGSFRVAYKKHDGTYTDLLTVNTSGTLDYNKISAEIVIPTDIHLDMSISIITTNSSLVEIYGVWCYEDSTSLMVNNYSRPGARLYQIENTVINRMCEANFLVFALGHNDWAIIDEGGDGSLKSVFSSKIDLIINNVNSRNTPILIMDYVWKKDVKDSFIKQELQRLYKSCNNSYYIDTMLYIRKDRDINKAISDGLFIDVSHPSDKGHELIADMICKTLNINIIPKSTDLTIGVANTDIILQNGITTGSVSIYNTIGRIKKENGVVRLFMNLYNLQHNVVAFNIPVGYRPKMTIKFLVEGYVGTSNNALTYMTISSNGDVKFLLTSINSYLINSITTEVNYMI